MNVGHLQRTIYVIHKFNHLETYVVRESALDVGGHGFEPWSGPTNDLKQYQRLIKLVLANALLGTQH